MDQFDKLIKEKAEKREFKYKPIFWLLFAKQAGFMAFSAIQIISGVLIVGGIISGSVFLTQILLKKNSAPKIVEQPTYPIITTDTTIQTIPDVVYQKDTIIPENSSTVPSKKLNQNTNAQTSPHKTMTKPDTATIQKVNPVNPYAGRRILTIDPDTILTND